MKAVIFLVITFLCYASCTKMFLDLTSSTSTPEILKFSLYNPTTATFGFLNWKTPFEPVIRGNIFDITHRATGMKAEYYGMLVRRGSNITDEEFVYFTGGQTKTASVNLFNYYLFPLAGEYIISYTSFEYITPEVTFSASTSVILSEGDIVYNQRVHKTNLELRANQLTSTNCNANQDSQVASSVTGSINECRRAYNCMTARTCANQIATWFGNIPVGGALYEYDRACFNSIHSRLSGSTFNAYCNPAGCGNNVYGYVYPSDAAYTVYLCALFWSIPAERVNTIVHEMSHFSRLCTTNDYTYGKSSCQSLARSNPTQATHNADNVCYFSEVAPSE